MQATHNVISYDLILFPFPPQDVWMPYVSQRLRRLPFINYNSQDTSLQVFFERNH